MILAVDVGNTETVIGLFAEPREPLRIWRLATDRRRTGDELALVVRGFLAGLEGARAERAAIASVVPALDRSWSDASRALDLPARFLTGASPVPIRLDVDHPSEVGADRVANTLAAARLYGRDTIVVDLGTATTFDCISAEGVFLGGVIAPGPQAGLDVLTRATARLPQVRLAPPRAVIGRNTLDCLASGGFYSVVDGIDGIVTRIAEEWGGEEAPLVVATGGMAVVVGPHCATVDRIEPGLTITGLALAAPHLFGEADA